MGWVPQDTQPGDTLCVFQGYRLPFALREQGKDHLLLGNAYIHGMIGYQA
jgi:hypothetical protein